MSTELDTRPQQAAALAIRPGQTDWDKYQAAALAQIGLKDASNADRAVFLHQCQRTGLDPFAKQIYMIPRSEKQRDGSWGIKWTIQTGIDGWRVIRDRAARRDKVRVETSRAIWYDDAGSEYKVWVQPVPATACEITVTVDGIPYTSVLLYREYVQVSKEGKPVAQWAVKPNHMTEKCTEADALRKAFPQDFAGLSLDDAMPPPDDTPAPGAGRVTAKDIRGHTRPQVRAEVIGGTSDTSPAGRQAAPAPAPAAPSGPPPGPAGEAPNHAPRPTSGQLSIIGNHFRRLGFDLDDPAVTVTMLGSVAQLAGLDDIASPGDLDQDQAARVIKWLAKCSNASDLEMLLSDGEVPSE